MGFMPAIFLDRDGVIIENRSDYVKSWQEVIIYPQALIALAVLSRTPYKIVVVTNQSAVAKGLTDLAEVQVIHRNLVGEVASAGGRIDACYLCPHSPEDQCRCRKPKPGLLIQASQELSIDLGASIMIGDALTDLQAGQAAGVGMKILVLSGRGKAQAGLPEAGLARPFQVCADLLAASQLILQQPVRK